MRCPYVLQPGNMAVCCLLMSLSPAPPSSPRISPAAALAALRFLNLRLLFALFFRFSYLSFNFTQTFQSFASLTTARALLSISPSLSCASLLLLPVSRPPHVLDFDRILLHSTADSPVDIPLSLSVCLSPQLNPNPIFTLLFSSSLHSMLLVCRPSVCACVLAGGGVVVAGGRGG